MLRSRLEIFRSVNGAEKASVQESLEKTAWASLKTPENYCPFAEEQDGKEAVSGSEETGGFLPWSKEWKDYEKELKEKEKTLPLAPVNFLMSGQGPANKGGPL